MTNISSTVYLPYSVTAPSSTIKTTRVITNEVSSDLDPSGLTRDLILKVRDSDACDAPIRQDKDIILDASSVVFRPQECKGSIRKSMHGHFQLQTDDLVLSLDAEECIRLEKDQKNQRNLFFEEIGTTSRIEKTDFMEDLAIVTNHGDIRFRRHPGDSEPDPTEIVFTQSDMCGTSPLIRTGEQVDMHVKAGVNLHLGSQGQDNCDPSNNFIVADSRLRIQPGMYITGSDEDGLKLVPDVRDKHRSLTLRNMGDELEIGAQSNGLHLSSQGGHVHVSNGNDLHVHQDIVHSESTQFQIRSKESILLAPDLPSAEGVETTRGVVVSLEDTCSNISIKGNVNHNLEIGTVSDNKEVIVTSNLRIKEDLLHEGAIQLAPNVPQGDGCVKQDIPYNKLVIENLPSNSSSCGDSYSPGNLRLSSAFGDMHISPAKALNVTKSVQIVGNETGDVNYFSVQADGENSKVILQSDTCDKVSQFTLHDGNARVDACNNIVSTAQQSLSMSAVNGDMCLESGGNVNVVSACVTNMESHGDFSITAMGPTSNLYLASSQNTVVLSDNELCLQAPIISIKDDKTQTDIHGDVNLRKNLTVGGDLSVKGNTYSYHVTDMYTNDKNIKLASTTPCNKYLYYGFRQVGCSLQYKRYAEESQGSSAIWQGADDLRFSLYADIEFFFLEDGKNPTWTDFHGCPLPDGTFTTRPVDSLSQKYTAYLFHKEDDVESYPCYKYHYCGHEIEFKIRQDTPDWVTRDGTKNDGAGVIVEGILPENVSFKDPSKNKECSEKSIRWNHGVNGVMGWKPKSDDLEILDYACSSASNGSYWEFKGGSLQLTRCIHGAAWVKKDGNRSIHNDDVVVSYRFEIDDNENLCLVKVAGTDGLGTGEENKMRSREVVAAMGGGFAYVQRLITNNLTMRKNSGKSKTTCQGVTQKGTPCAFGCLPGKNFCKHHEHQEGMVQDATISMYDTSY